VEISYQQGVVYVRKGLNAIVNAGIPETPLGLCIAGWAAWYGGRVAETYAPRLIADIIINSCVHSSLGPTIGWSIGVTIAPIFTPSFTPKIAILMQGTFAYAAAVVSNIAIKIFIQYQQTYSDKKGTS
jgi:hypothetical protein